MNILNTHECAFKSNYTMCKNPFVPDWGFILWNVKEKKKERNTLFGSELSRICSATNITSHYTFLFISQIPSTFWEIREKIKLKFLLLVISLDAGEITIND